MRWIDHGWHELFLKDRFEKGFLDVVFEAGCGVERNGVWLGIGFGFGHGRWISAIVVVSARF